MRKFIRAFENHNQYEAFTGTSEFILPNISWCRDDIETVHYNPYVPETRVVAKYNVTSTSSPTKIGYNQYTSGFSAIEIDGVAQPSVVSAYTFSTIGKHTVKYTLADPTSIGQSAFYYCSGLTSIEIPDNVTSIGGGAFSNCTSLSSITIPNSVTSIGNSAFHSCSSLSSITIPNSVTSIGVYAFYGCSSLSSITIPNSVTSIGSYVFQYCVSSRNITIPDNVTSIGAWAFSYCTSLSSCTIGSGVTSIDRLAFQTCSSLTSITCNAMKAPSIDSQAFSGVHTDGTLYVLSGSTGYDVWMGTGNDYLGKYGWTKVEQ